MKSSRSSDTKTLHIDAIRPYWRNPRKISDRAVEAVKASLQRFGYLQPIVVDPENVIIIGHTRYTAMRRMEVEQVQVLVADLPPEESKQLRLIDNQTHEMTDWEDELLGTELARLEAVTDALINDLFPEASEVSDDFDLSKIDVVEDTGEPQKVDFICPNCFHEWERTITRAQVLSGYIAADEE